MREGLHKIVSDDETIVAIATPPGHSGIGVIRVSGKDSLKIAGRCFKAHSQTTCLEHRATSVGFWYDDEGTRIDEVVVSFFEGPSSYTGEDVLEISAHGNPLILRRIVETVTELGARAAAPGEFTLRAVCHGKMDLIQAEAVREFVEAQTQQQARTALSQMEGSLSKYVRPIKENLVSVVAHLEAGIDFAEDDVDVPANALIAGRIRPLRKALDGLSESFAYGKILSNGLRLVILGKPNVGKSSLFNRLLSVDRAIVTEIPGTTRDVLTETISISGVPICLADTAGIRDTTDVVESMGVARAIEALSSADYALVVLDGSGAFDDDDRQALQKASPIPHIVVVNKVDLPPVLDCARLNGSPRVSVSAKTGQGLDELEATLQAFLLSRKTHLADDLTLTNRRQYEAIVKASEALSTAERAAGAGVPHEMVLLDLYDALSSLGELTGEVVTEDILERIFSTFCIGK